MSVLCPYCRNDAELVDSLDNRGNVKGKKWVCEPCGASVGVHKNSKTFVPLGTLANAELRHWRVLAHRSFDPIWMHCERINKCSRLKARSDGYRWLSESLSIPIDRCHIGKLTLDECMLVVEFCEPFADRLK